MSTEGISSENPVEVINKLIGIERELARELRELGYEVMQVKPTIATLLIAMSYDCDKHTVMLESLRRILSLVIEVPIKHLADKLMAIIEKHRAYEEMSIKFLEGLLNNPVITKEGKLIINLILEDEKRHYEILTRIHRALVEGKEFYI
ncbi:MAG: hypothetical protein QXF42_06685 [Sulfolobales archaeon]